MTFAGLFLDSVWTSDDGLTWRNPHGGDLPALVAGLVDAGAGWGPGDLSSFTAVSPVPGTGAAYLTALVADRNRKVTAKSFWTTDGSDDWWRL